MRNLLVLGVVAIATTAAASQHDVATAIDDRLVVADGAREMVATKTEAREAQLRERVRAAYKLFRAGWTPLWVDEKERSAMVRRRAAARRILRRDVAELVLLDEELADADAALVRLQRERVAADALAVPERRSLVRPVPGRILERFGTYRHDATNTQLSRRGVEMLTRPGREVRAVADGTVSFVGQVDGLGRTLIIDHGDLISVIGRLGPVALDRGATVARGDVVGAADDRQVYVEIRLPIGPGGEPIDPEPLFARR